METLGRETEILKEVSRKKGKKDGSWGKGMTVISNEANSRSGYAAKLESASYTWQTYIQLWFILLITKKEKVTGITFPAFASQARTESRKSVRMNGLSGQPRALSKHVSGLMTEHRELADPRYLSSDFVTAMFSIALLFNKLLQ